MSREFTDPVLLVEDTPSLSMVYQSALERAGLSVTPVFCARDGLAAFRKHANRVVLLDLMLPDGNGLDVLREMRTQSPQTRILVITANGSINRAVEAMRSGAFDFLVKPFDDRRLLSAVRNAITSLAFETDEADLDAPNAPAETEMDGFVGSSPRMRQIYGMIRNIGRSTATVFITGESGTGKEVCARAIHAVSARAAGPFVPLNCAAIPRDLLESEVFGHLKGAFTGALSDKPGAAAVADGGTLFLDEICEMDLSLQTKLLRFLQTSTIQPVGAARPIPVNVRIVCATNRDPAEEVRQGRFREDLYYRLHVVPIHMPPLRSRPEDIMDIARASLLEFAAEEGKSFTGFEPEAAAMLAARPWPGNVRQLLNVIRNIVVLQDGPLVRPGMLPAEIVAGPVAVPAGVTQMPPPVARSSASATRARVELLVGTPLADVERELIEATIAHCEGSIPRAAKVLGVSPSTLYRKLESWTGAQRRSGT
jgi:two-component system, repressor protein LuxO